MNWHRFTQVQNVPPSQAALALGMIGLGHAWVLYYPAVGMVIRPYLAFSGALLLLLYCSNIFIGVLSLMIFGTPYQGV